VPYALGTSSKERAMRKTMAAALLTAAAAVGFMAKPAAAGPENRCNGQIVAGIASTWPWAHNDKVAFPPPPGAIALWIQEFGPFVGVSSVRELLKLFCSPT
jgi:hypothetical protein